MNESALKDRIKAVAVERNIRFNEAWKLLLLERFLDRLSRSKHQDQFVFKGGLLLSQYLAIGRETIDIDFLMRKLKNDESLIQSAISEIIEVKIADEFIFEFDSIEQLKQPHMEYVGYRVTLKSFYGKMRDHIQIDIGVGDEVIPKKEKYRSLEYRGKPIFEGEIALMVYPVETIFAEKLETLLQKGSVNSRMKDYHDLLLMIREKGLLNKGLLSSSIKATFENRGTKINIPIFFDTDGVKSLQKIWEFHIKGLGKEKEKHRIPQSIESVIDEINQYITSVVV